MVEFASARIFLLYASEDMEGFQGDLMDLMPYLFSLAKYRPYQLGLVCRTVNSFCLERRLACLIFSFELYLTCHFPKSLMNKWSGLPM